MSPRAGQGRKRKRGQRWFLPQKTPGMDPGPQESTWLLDPADSKKLEGAQSSRVEH